MKKFRDILGDMASWITLTNSKVTNFTVGSVIRSILEAVAMELEDMYHYIRYKFAELQDNAIYQSFGFARKPAMPATGMVTVRFTQPLSQSVPFSSGYRFFTQPIEGKTVYFEVIEDSVANIGHSEVDLRVRCVESGVVGNVPAYAISRVVNSVPFLASVFNRDRFFTGMPEESKEDRQKRFSSFVDSLGRCSNPAITYGCMQIDRVAGVYIKEDIGMIYVYVHDAFGNFDEDLRKKVEDVLLEYKAGGVKAIVSGVTKRTVDLNVKVLVAEGYNKSSILFRIEDEIAVYMNRMTVSKSLIRADLIRAIMSVDREAIQNISISINADIIIQQEELIRPGVITVEEMG